MVSRHRHLLVTDLDGTLIGDVGALGRFRDWLEGHRDRWSLAYASGRSHGSIQAVTEELGLPEPDAVASSVGTVLHVGATHIPWRRPGRRGAWRPEAVRATLADDPALELQPLGADQGRVSYWTLDRTPEAIDAIRDRLRAADLDVEVVYSNDKDLDVLPAWAGKGIAARRIARRFAVRATDVVVSGDSGNDVDLYRHGFRGVMVGNAEPSLAARSDLDAYRSPYPHADGILDGIRHWTASCCWTP